MECPQHVLDAVRPRFLGRRKEKSPPDPEAVVGWGYRFVTGVIREVLDSEDDEGEPDLPHQALLGEVARARTAYLTLGSDDPWTVASGGEVHLFDPWG